MVTVHLTNCNSAVCLDARPIRNHKLASITLDGWTLSVRVPGMHLRTRKADILTNRTSENCERRRRLAPAGLVGWDDLIHQYAVKEAGMQH